MERILVDTSIVMAILRDEPPKERIIALTNGYEIFATETLSFEVANAISSHARRGLISEGQAAAMYAAFETIRIGVFAVDIAASVELAARYRLYAYDAFILSTAGREHTPLMTLDAGMRRVALAMRLKVIEATP